MAKFERLAIYVCLCIYSRATLFMLLYTVLESPRWLIARSRNEQAENIMRKIMGTSLAAQAVLRCSMAEKRANVC